jgi:hypothetical protein
MNQQNLRLKCLQSKYVGKNLKIVRRVRINIYFEEFSKIRRLLTTARQKKQYYCRYLVLVGSLSCFKIKFVSARDNIF